MMRSLNGHGAKATPAGEGLSDGSFEHRSPVNNRDKRPDPRVATLHCATVITRARGEASRGFVHGRV
jgi:hypothetical protein